MIVGSKDICAMTCAAVRWPHDRKTKDQVTGAAVFDMVDGLLITTIKSLDPDVYDLKYASHAYCWADKLERSLKAKDRMVKAKETVYERFKLKYSLYLFSGCRRFQSPRVRRPAPSKVKGTKGTFI